MIGMNIDIATTCFQILIYFFFNHYFLFIMSNLLLLYDITVSSLGFNSVLAFCDTLLYFDLESQSFI